MTIRGFHFTERQRILNEKCSEMFFVSASDYSSNFALMLIFNASLSTKYTLPTASTFLKTKMGLKCGKTTTTIWITYVCG
jgi:hypothetical protein